MWTSISHSITTSIPRILEKSSPHINVRRSSKPVPYYHNSSLLPQWGYYYPATSNPIQVQLIWLDQIETVSKINPFRRFVEKVIKAVKANSKRLLCIHFNNLVHQKCKGTNSTKRLKSYDLQRWIYYRCYLKELPFFNAHNLSEETISTNDQTIQNSVHSEALEIS